MINKYVNITSQDKAHEECGVFGIYKNNSELDVVDITRDALYGLQHRGHISAGITVNEGEEYSIDATGILDIAGQLQIHGQSKVFQKEIERFELSSDSAMLLNSMSTEEKEELKNTCFSNLAATLFSLMGNKQVMDAVSALNVQ